MRSEAVMCSILLLAGCHTVPMAVIDKTGEKVADVAEQNTEIAVTNKDIERSFDAILTATAEHPTVSAEKITPLATAGKAATQLQGEKIAAQTKTIKELWAAKNEFDAKVAQLSVKATVAQEELKRLRLQRLLLGAALGVSVLAAGWLLVKRFF